MLKPVRVEMVIRALVGLLGLGSGMIACNGAGATSVSDVAYCSPVFPDQRFDSEYLVDFGPRLLGVATTRVVGISNSGPSPVRVDAIEAVSPQLAAFSWKLLKPVDGVVERGTTAELEITFLPDAVRVFQGELVLRMRNADPAALRVSLVGEGFASHCSIAPNFLDFGAVEAGSIAEREVEVKNDSNLAWRFDGSNSNGPFSIESVTIPEHGKAMVRVLFQPSSSSVYSGSLLVVPVDCSPNAIQVSGSGR